MINHELMTDDQRRWLHFATTLRTREDYEGLSMSDKELIRNVRGTLAPSFSFPWETTSTDRVGSVHGRLSASPSRSKVLRDPKRYGAH